MTRHSLSTFTPGLLGFAIAAALAFPMRASSLNPGDAALAATAQDVATACAEQTKLYNQLVQLQQRQALLRQIMANYGFTQVAAEFDATTANLRDYERAQNEANKELTNLTLDSAKLALEEYVTTLVKNPDAVGGVSATFFQLMQRLPMDVATRNRIVGLASNPATRVQGYNLALDWINKFTLPAELTLAAEEGSLPLAWKGFIEAASVVSPQFGHFLKISDWAARQLWTLGAYHWNAAQIRTLTTSTEADLRALQDRTKELAVIADDIRKINRATPALAQRCDTTRLTRATSEPKSKTTETKKSGGGAAKSMVGLAAAGLGGYYGAKLLLNAADSCGDSPNEEYYSACPGSGCSSVRAKYIDWCKCNGYSGFDGNGCY